MSTFTLHSDLIRDGIMMGHFPLCQVLMINDATYPWFVLVPRRSGISDIIDLPLDDYQQLWTESRVFSQAIMQAFIGEKLNVAALGNMTPQLHIHHIIRYKTDPAWPRPIWGHQPLIPYNPQTIDAQRKTLKIQNIPHFTILG